MKHLPKFLLSSDMIQTTSNLSTTEDDGSSSRNEFVVTRLPLRGKKRGRDKSKEIEKDEIQIDKRQERYAEDV